MSVVEHEAVPCGANQLLSVYVEFKSAYLRLQFEEHGFIKTITKWMETAHPIRKKMPAKIHSVLMKILSLWQLSSSRKWQSFRWRNKCWCAYTSALNNFLYYVLWLYKNRHCHQEQHFFSQLSCCYEINKCNFD